MEPRLGFHLIFHVGRELGPALMWSTRCFIRCVLELLWSRNQIRRNRWEWSREIVDKGTMCGTRGCWRCIDASHRRLVRWVIGEAECLAGTQQVRSHDRCGPSCCSNLEHTSSTDCAFSFLLQVLCLAFRHRISFQPFGWPQSKNPLLVVMTLPWNRGDQALDPGPTSRQRRSVRKARALLKQLSNVSLTKAKILMVKLPTVALC